MTKPKKPSDSIQTPDSVFVSETDYKSYQPVVGNGCQWDDYDKHLGNDPGDKNLFTMCDDTDKKTQCSSKEYRTSLGFTRYHKALEKRLKQYPFIKELQRYSFKVSNLETYLNHCTKVFKLSQKVFKLYTNRYFRKMRFKFYVKRKQFFHRMCKKIIGEGKKVVIGYGNGGNNSKGLRNFSKMPVVAFRQYLGHHVCLCDIDEFYTTFKCSVCHSKTGNVYGYKYIKTAKGVSRQRSMIYGLRRCTNNECRITWDRDRNASRHILTILKWESLRADRPKYLKHDREPCLNPPQESCTGFKAVAIASQSANLS